MDSKTSRPIIVQLPDRATLIDLILTSPSEGWAVGAVFGQDFRGTQAGLILRYHDSQWQSIDDPLPSAFLDSIAMVSPTEGWVTGYNRDNGESYLLHYVDGHWQLVMPPVRPTQGGYYGGIRMFSPHEGWLVVNPASGWKGDRRESVLLHYRQGAWTPIAVPVPLVWDFVPVGPDDLWLVGNASTLGPNRKDSTLAHFQGGRWTTTPAPDHVLLHTLRMLSVTEGYAIGWQPQYGGTGGSPPPAAVLHYNGTSWQPYDKGADQQAQTIFLFDQTDGWAFVRTPIPPAETFRANDVISRVQHKVGSSWQDVDWPFADVIHIGSLVRAAPGEYWATAQYVTPPEIASHFHRELLHFFAGVWHEYPPRVAE